MNFIAWGVKLEVSMLIQFSIRARPFRSLGTSFPDTFSLR